MWTAGTNQTHALGATVVDYATATHIAMISKGIKVEHAQAGTHTAALITSRTEDTDPDPDADFLLSYDTSATALKKVKMSNLAGSGSGWTPNVLAAPDTVTYNGNRSYDLVFNSVDYTSTVSNGMRLRATRTVTAPTQCTDLEASSSQYWSKTSPAGISFTTTFTCAAWVKLESYGAAGGIINRRNADTEGWFFGVNASGQLTGGGLRIAANNKIITSYQSIPLNKWVHVAICVDMTAADTTAQKIWIDGVEVPRSYTLTGTATALVQGTTALVVGALKSAGTDPFDGKIAQASVHSACLSDAQIKAMASQTISSSTPSIVSGFTFDGVATDVTANANDLSASGGAVATTVDSPFNSTEYGIITANSFSTNTTLTVQVPEGYAIPTSGGVSAVAYSTQDVPYGFPRDKGKWTLDLFNSVTDFTQLNPTATTYYNPTGFSFSIPIGAFRLVGKYATEMRDDVGSPSDSCDFALSTSTSAFTDRNLVSSKYNGTGGGTSTFLTTTDTVESYISNTSATTYYGVLLANAGTITYIQFRGAMAPTTVTATLAYV